MQKPTIAVGLSGGVDSAVAAWLLKKNHHVIAIFMQNWHEHDAQYCQASNDLADAQRVADQLGIPLHILDFSEAYMSMVFDVFKSDLRAGLTPNPDVLCNQFIKFDCLLQTALDLNAIGLATGHYAQKIKHNGQVHLAMSADTNKDQTYFLAEISRDQLKHAYFPLGHMTKQEVRAIAAREQLVVAQKKDSTGICFIGERKFNDFLSNHLLTTPGDIVTEHGEVIGQHDGCIYFTIGQRKGLKIGGRKHTHETPWYVAKKDMTRHQVMVVQGEKHPLLYSRALWCAQPSLNWPDACHQETELKARIRHRGPLVSCCVRKVDHDRLHVVFETPQRAITPGQYVVFYKNNLCLGGGKIMKTAH